MNSETANSHETLHSQLIIGVDCDDVIMHFTKAFVAYYNNRYGEEYIFDDFIDFDLTNILGRPREEVIKILDEFYQSPEQKNALPHDGAFEALAELRKHHKLVIVTSRPDAVRDLTCEWVARHFPDVFERILFTSQFSHDGKLKSTKGELAKINKMKIIIDDGLHNAIDIAEKGMTVLLLNKPWNQGELPENVIRVFSWAEILEYINAYSHSLKERYEI